MRVLVIGNVALDEVFAVDDLPAPGQSIHGRADIIRARLGAEPVRVDLVTVAGVDSDLSIILRNRAGENAIITTNAAARGLSAEAACGMLAGARAGDRLVMQGNLSLRDDAFCVAAGPGAGDADGAEPVAAAAVFRRAVATG